jgi:hypothetical protein
MAHSDCAVDPDKIKSIMDWPTPKDVYDIRSFMGLVGYYRRFIKGFSRIGCPITSLQKRELNSFGHQNVKKEFKS